jgi:hypothetical protein
VTVAPWSRWPYAIGAAVAVVLLVFAGRYGYHRDELYFLVAGDHLAWGYVDQGPMAPFVARLMPDGLVWLRTPSALLSAVTVVLVAAIARELGGGRPAQVLAAAIAAVSAIVLATGHLHTTTTFDVFAWVAICWLVARALRTGNTRLVTVAGAVAGLDLLNKYLVGMLGLALAGGLLIAGPRRWLRDPWVLGGAALALVIAAPNLIWQATHGWPQLDMAESLSTGDTSYGGRLVFVGLQFVMVSPFLLPILVAGAVMLFRRPQFRALAWTWVLVTVLFLIVGGKGYYTAGLLLVLAAAGSVVTVEWWSRSRARQVLVAVAVAASAAAHTVMFLPVLPPDQLPDAILAVNYDAGETIGWPAFADSVASVYRSLPPDEQARAVILTRNYGEAGAIAKYGPSRSLPRAYSGHNSMADFGMPPASADVVVAVGFGERRLDELFSSVQRAGQVDLGIDIDNDENGAPLWVCREPRAPWPQLWERVRVVG